MIQIILSWVMEKQNSMWDPLSEEQRVIKDDKCVELNRFLSRYNVINLRSCLAQRFHCLNFNSGHSTTLRCDLTSGSFQAVSTSSLILQYINNMSPFKMIQVVEENLFNKGPHVTYKVLRQASGREICWFSWATCFSICFTALVVWASA